MTALFGWAGPTRKAPLETLQRMAAAAVVAGNERRYAAAPAVSVGVAGRPSTCALFEHDGVQIALIGHPRMPQSLAADDSIAATARTFLAEYRQRAADAIADLHGDFALAIHDKRNGETTLAVDRMGVHAVYYQPVSSGVIFGSSLDVLTSHPDSGAKMRAGAIYDYLFFHVIPGPLTIYEDVWRLPPGSFVTVRNGAMQLRPYWQLTFQEADVDNREHLKQRFVDTLLRATEKAADGASCGAFLSGGTDSSTITGMLSRLKGHANTYSIGFDVPGYDEMEYARITARHFGTAHHEYYVTPADVLEATPRVANAYDQPFGNASALPTYMCARLAATDGVERLLAGDGGDELFGGNARYAKQHLLGMYQRVPQVLRRRLIEPALINRRFVEHVPGLRKLQSYVEQARPPMPQRYESYNLLEHLGPERVLTGEFLSSVDRDAPHALMRDAHRPFADAALINQMLGIDLRFTLADNDLPKVTRMCALAGIDVAFPMLDVDVVALAAALPAQLKLGGTRLRPFFKDSLRDLLPAQTISKKKQGFGLPVGQWLHDDRALNELARDSIAAIEGDGIFRKTFLTDLFDRLLPAHPAYYGTMIWLLMMFSLWKQGRGERRSALASAL